MINQDETSMKKLLIVATTNVLLDPDRVKSMSEAEYLAAVRDAKNVNARGEDGETPLHVAAAHGIPEIVTALIEAGADVNARATGGMTPLHVAALSEKPEIVTALSEAGADVNARMKAGETPLHLAAMRGTPEVVTALLEAGASGSVKNSKGETPFDLAEGNEKIKGTDAYWKLNDAQYA